MKIGIVGARKYQDRQSVLDLVMALPADATIITSSCKGVCTWVKEVAEERGMKVIVFSPDLSNIRAWFDIPKRYYQRNKEMVESCDLLHAFVSAEDGFIGGTRFEVEYAVSGARRSLGCWNRREVNPRLKFAEGVQWVRIPPGKGCHPPEASLASVGKSESGSVDSKY
jgi:hypothetical protein